MEEILLEKLLEAHRLLRHDIINYFQVISGYQQIGHADKTSEYINKAIEILRNYSPAAKIELPLLQSLLIWCIAHYNTDCEVITLEIAKKFSAWKQKDRELTGLIMRILYVLEDKLKKRDVCCTFSFTEDPLPRIDLILKVNRVGLTSALIDLCGNLSSEEFVVKSAENGPDSVSFCIAAE